jgi:uncharacterized protein YjiS (DUF1127 family)
MAFGTATINLGSTALQPRRADRLLRLLLTVEAWLDRRASRRALYRMDDHALADIGLSRADVDGIDHDPALSLGHLLPIPDAGPKRA